MKPLQIGIIIASVILALGGLYVFTTFTGFGAKKEQIGTVFIWGTLPQSAIDAGIDALTAAGDNRYAAVSYEEHPAGSFDTDLANAIAAGSGPDLILISQEDLVSERTKIQLIPFTTIPQRTFVAAYLPLFELFLTEEGTYGVPLVLDPLVMYYNRGLLASAGVPTPPTTWEAISGLALQMTRRDDRGTVTRSLIPLGEYANISNARAILSLLLMQSGASITEQTQVGVASTLISGGDPAFGSTPAQSAVSFYAQFANPAKTVYTWNRALPQSRQSFLSGDLVLYPGFASEQLYLSQANPNLDFDMARMPQPATNASRVGYGAGYAFAIPKAAANPQGAVTVALGLTSAEPMLVIANALSMAPARRDLLVASTDNLYTAIFYQEALIAQGWLSPAPYITDAIFSAMISDIITGRLDVELAVQKADQSLDAVLR